MKKQITAAVAALMLAAAVPQTVFAAWGINLTQKEETGYEFVSGTTRIAVNEDAADVLKSLGDPEKTFEQESCAYQGKDVVYSYKDFELATYPVEKKEYVSSIYFLTDQAATEEGIRFGSSYDDMVKAYGDDYTVENEVYRYTKNGTELAFYMTNKKIDAIEYTIALDQGK